MRIISKEYDFYDYLQDYNDTIVFDRRKSFNLTKEIVCSKLGNGYNELGKYCKRDDGRDYRHIVLQSCCTFWLILLIITERDFCDCPKNYKLKFLHTWRNYKAKRRLLEVFEISNAGIINVDKMGMEYERVYDEEYAFKHLDWSISYATDYSSNYRTISNYVDYDGNEYSIPILRYSGIDHTIINPLDLFCSIEEYFSMEKTESETTEPKGVTNNDKIIMHGFDTKISFRGK